MPAMGGERAGLGALLGSYLLGINPMDTRLVNQRIEEFNYIGMRNGWVEAAFWDLIGKARGEPLWKVLGGQGGRVRPYASLGSNHDHDPNTVAALVRARREEGFDGVKIRVKSTDFDRMIEVVAAARDALGSRGKLMIDANLGWPVEIVEPSPRWDEAFAIRFAKALERYDVAWLEEPLHRLSFESLARLRASTRTPIAGAEVNSSWRDFKSMLELGSLDVYQPDAILCGGTIAGGVSTVYWLQREIARRNAVRPEHERPVVYTPHTWTNGLGFALNLQLFGLVAPSERGLLELPYDVEWEPHQWAPFIKGGFRREADGTVAIPDAPGLGVELDWGVLERFGQRLYHGTRATVAARALADYGVHEALYLKGKKEALAEWSAKAEFTLPEPPF
jgi:L-alanine-DL-glutamate epimerase-like enolase superfamily enzyme